jgi:hypothetical protein
MGYGQDGQGGSASMMMRRIIGIVGTVLLLLAMLVLGPKLFENVDASEVLLIQSPGGNLGWHTQPGWVYQGFGKVTAYRKAGQIRFTQDKETDSRIKIQFNDAGTGLIKGSINYELPLDPVKMTEIHSFYPTQEALENSLIKPALNKSIYLTGPLMSSKESYAERRTQMIQYVEDQTQNGVYLTSTRIVEVPDESAAERLDPNGKPLPPPTKRVTLAEIQMSNSVPSRAEQGQLARFNIRAFNFAIEDLDYEATVDQQIAQQQGITMAVQTSIAQAKQAQQDAITAAAKGSANIAQTRAEQEVEKTRAVVQAEKEREVARLNAEKAGFYKTEQILRADADSEYKRRILAADGALQQKLATYEKVQGMWAQAFQNYKGQLVPGVVMGGGPAGGNAAQVFMDLLTAKTAKDLALTMTPTPPPQQ